VAREITQRGAARTDHARSDHAGFRAGHRGPEAAASTEIVVDGIRGLGGQFSQADRHLIAHRAAW